MFISQQKTSTSLGTSLFFLSHKRTKAFARCFAPRPARKSMGQGMGWSAADPYFDGTDKLLNDLASGLKHLALCASASDARWAGLLPFIVALVSDE